MENSADSYLHKKFKKQLSIEPKSQNYDKENKDSAPRIVVSSEEKASEVANQGECNKVTEDKTNIDNNDSVPNQSTNENRSYVLNVSNLSSISVGNCIAKQQSAKSSISFVVSNTQNDEEVFKPSSFDTTYSNFLTNSSISSASVVSTSSILNNLYSKDNYGNREDNSSCNSQDDCTLKANQIEENFDVKIEDIQPPPDKNSSGKYVCTYCNLVCSKPSVLQKHIRAHTNERPYPCISCGFSFKTRSNLYKHCRSRTHANRVMGNKSQSGNEMDNQQVPPKMSPSHMDIKEENLNGDIKSKPYKPRFHSSNFIENVSKEITDDEKQNNKHTTSELLSHHINEIINKNNSIINSRQSSFMKKRYNELITDNANNNEYVQRFNRSDSVHVNNSTEPNGLDEPLNLTNKNRKRCMSEISEQVGQKSLIKELLLKSMTSDMQCRYCKMIFQTVTELDVHKYRNCKGKPDVKYTRSSSVNVASILTQNKNAFDNIPQLQNTVFPLNSPGPFLGKTRLVDTDKTKSFSFDSGNLPLMSPNDVQPSYLSSSPFDREKKTPVKLFGGEVKVHSLGETKSFKIDNTDDKCEPQQNYLEYGGKLSENRVIKSSLQSGGTVLTNKANYNKQDLRMQQDIIRVYENTSVSPSIDIPGICKSKFTFDRQTDTVADNREQDNVLKHIVSSSSETLKVSDTVPNPMYKYTNIMDFSQKAVKLLTPNIKQPFNLHPPISLFNKMHVDNCKTTISEENETRRYPNSNINMELKANIAVNHIKKQKKLYCDGLAAPMNNTCNPVNLLVNGKVIRYVPGMPGPIVTEDPRDVPYDNKIISVEKSVSKDLPQHAVIQDKFDTAAETFKSNKVNSAVQIDRPIIDRLPKLDTLEIKTDFHTKLNEPRSPLKINDMKSPEIRSCENDNMKETKKFARPNSLALKPTTASLKQHHGLTPTMFNQILISPDTPRVAKKYAEHFLHGNYFSYLGLKSSTKPVYCTLNKTQPFYVPHFKKLSMYSEWRQQDTKADKLYVSNYDSRQKSQRYTTAGKTMANLIIHSSYRFIISEASSGSTENEDEQKNSAILGGYESNEDYTYIRGRGRGRYVCDQCGIRCKKPSMLKKHIRTHSDDRPYTCSHCNFSFKTKGNLTKHMKSKVHTKNSSSCSSTSSAQQGTMPSSESDTEDSGMDSSDESTRQQEHEAAYGLLSLSQKPTQTNTHSQSETSRGNNPIPVSELFMSTEEIVYVSKTSYAKNKILDENSCLSFPTNNNIEHATMITVSEETMEARNLRNYLGKSSVSRPLTYPYMSTVPSEPDTTVSTNMSEITNSNESFLNSIESDFENKSVKQVYVTNKYVVTSVQSKSPIKMLEDCYKDRQEIKADSVFGSPEKSLLFENKNLSISGNKVLPTLKINDVVISNDGVNDLRKRKFPLTENDCRVKIHRNDEVMDLSMSAGVERQDKIHEANESMEQQHFHSNHIQPEHGSKKLVELFKGQPSLMVSRTPEKVIINEENDYKFEKSDNVNSKRHDGVSNGTVIILAPLQHENNISANYIKDNLNNNTKEISKPADYDNSAMETLADVATQREKLDKKTLAQSVATEFLKLATKNEKLDGSRDSTNYNLINKDVNDIIVKAEGDKSCTICSKSFNKPSQLRLHMNIHYLERPFRCDSCSVSFRTKGHLQKHERSASHHNKLSSSPALSSSEPRPFKCVDCNIAFRIHGHLAKHLRSKMHIMKLECLAKIPFGLYAELERSNSLLTEINTCDGDQCLESLKTLAQKVFINDPSKLNQLELRENDDADS